MTITKRGIQAANAIIFMLCLSVEVCSVHSYFFVPSYLIILVQFASYDITQNFHSTLDYSCGRGFNCPLKIIID